MNISVVGSGYVGLVSAVCLAEKGHRVVCVDQNEEKVAKINSAISPIYEPGLDRLLRKNIGQRLTATTDLHNSVCDTDISLIAVGTPFNGKEIDLTAIREVSFQLGTALAAKKSYHLVAVKSTVVPGTTDEVVIPILEEASGKKAGRDFGVGMNPEFLREGEAVGDFLSPDRVVLGGMDEKSLQMLEALYSVFEGTDTLKTNNRTAEMIKYTANALLATMISFSNEIGNLCASTAGVDVLDVMKGVHLDKRLSPILPDGTRITPSFTSYLAAGCGFGGSCFPKDVKALIAHGRKAGQPMELLDAVMEINRRQPEQIVSLLEKNFRRFPAGPSRYWAWRSSPGTDDLRESPAIPVVRSLLSQGARIRAYDPVAGHEAERLFGNHDIVYPDDLARTLDGVDAIVLLTRWEEFRHLPACAQAYGPSAFVYRRSQDDRKASVSPGMKASGWRQVTE